MYAVAVAKIAAEFMLGVVMNTAPLPSTKIPGFKVVSKHQLDDTFDESQSAFYILIGRHGQPEEGRESVLFVEYVDHFLGTCQQRIDEFWEKRRVLITHVAVKLGQRLRSHHRNLTEAYERALAVQSLRQQLHPRFRRP